jgi:hypothetical protein
MMRVKLLVDGGGSIHANGGEMSSPSQVYREGMGSPGRKTAEWSRKVT